MDRKFHMLNLGIIGLISGILSFCSIFPNITFFDMGYAPGIIFGLFVAGYFYLSSRKRSFLPLITFILISTGSYNLAERITLGMSNKSIHSLAELLFISGLVGACFLLLGFHYLLSKLKPQQFFVITIIGGILGLSFYIAPSHTESSSNWAFFSLYVFWQTGIAAALGYTLPSL